MSYIVRLERGFMAKTYSVLFLSILHLGIYADHVVVSKLAQALEMISLKKRWLKESPLQEKNDKVQESVSNSFAVVQKPSAMPSAPGMVPPPPLPKFTKNRFKDLKSSSILKSNQKNEKDFIDKLLSDDRYKKAWNKLVASYHEAFFMEETESFLKNFFPDKLRKDFFIFVDEDKLEDFDKKYFKKGFRKESLSGKKSRPQTPEKNDELKLSSLYQQLQIRWHNKYNNVNDLLLIIQESHPLSSSQLKDDFLVGEARQKAQVIYSFIPEEDRENKLTKSSINSASKLYTDDINRVMVYMQGVYPHLACCFNEIYWLSKKKKLTLDQAVNDYEITLENLQKKIKIPGAAQEIIQSMITLDKDEHEALEYYKERQVSAMGENIARDVALKVFSIMRERGVGKNEAVRFLKQDVMKRLKDVGRFDLEGLYRIVESQGFKQLDKILEVAKT